jgi:O-antigen/teichoic acid export membrane protein
MLKKLLQRKVVQDSMLYTIANVVVQLSSLVGVLFVSRYLGPTNLGIYSFVQNYIAGFLTILSGLDMYANWRIAKEDDWQSALRLYIRQKIAIVLPFLAIGGILSYNLLPADIVRFIPFLCIPVITSIFASSVFVVQYQNKTKIVTLGMIGSSLLLLVLKIIAVISGQSLVVFVAINSLDGILLIALCSYCIFTGATSKSVKKSLALPQLLLAAKYSIVYIVFWFIVTRADQFFVPAYFDAYSLGIYSSAVKVIEMTNVLLAVMQGVILPRMAYIQSEEGTTRRMHLTLAMYIGVSLCAAISIQILAPLAVHILFGPQFAGTVDILRVYAWSIPGLFVSYLFTVVAMSNNTVKILAFHSILIAAITVPTLLYVVSLQNILAIAWVSVIIYTISAMTLYFLWRKKYI